MLSMPPREALEPSCWRRALRRAAFWFNVFGCFRNSAPPSAGIANSQVRFTSASHPAAVFRTMSRAAAARWCVTLTCCWLLSGAGCRVPGASCLVSVGCCLLSGAWCMLSGVCWLSITVHHCPPVALRTVHSVLHLLRNAAMLSIHTGGFSEEAGVTETADDGSALPAVVPGGGPHALHSVSGCQPCVPLLWWSAGAHADAVVLLRCVDSTVRCSGRSRPGSCCCRSSTLPLSLRTSSWTCSGPVCVRTAP